MMLGRHKGPTDPDPVACQNRPVGLFEGMGGNRELWANDDSDLR